ncbi:MAG: hypothetical protein A2Z20_07075 [Bdellovibrionales bacterium RBG_16_40_8]|nr:MAG: hypothetical protein A2Z20_07075 [Bdellovibrionales bacterium RBG_16_40_8]
MKKKYLPAKGFTLIETLIALVITVGAALLLANAWSGNFLRIRKSVIYDNVALLLERKAVEIETKNRGKKLTEIAEEEGNFGDDYPQYRWKFSVQPFEMPDLTPLLINKSSGTDEMLITMLSKLREITNKAIVEGSITVYVKSGQKEISFSVTTYLVDYDSDINLTGGI